MKKHPIIKQLLKYDDTLHNTKIEFTKRGYSDKKEANNLLRNNPNAFIFAVIFDQGIPATRAWSAPYFLKKRLGHLDIEKIFEMGIDSLTKVCTKRPALHRYNYLASWIWEAADKLIHQYNKDASNIWENNLKAEVIIKRLLDFKGIGQKKANMATLLLWRDFEIPIKEVGKIDIAYDVHVRRVLLRTGIAKKDDLNHMVKIIRKLNPNFPARLDGPLWHIGRNWCHSRNPNCKECVLENVCPKLIERNID